MDPFSEEIHTDDGYELALKSMLEDTPEEVTCFATPSSAMMSKLCEI
jgi:hypothetical protein